MKVLQVINSLATGGAEKIILESVPKFVEKGIDVELLLLNGNQHPFLVELEEKHCCKIMYLGGGSVYNPFHIFKIMRYLKKIRSGSCASFPCSLLGCNR